MWCEFGAEETAECGEGGKEEGPGGKRGGLPQGKGWGLWGVKLGVWAATMMVIKCYGFVPEASCAGLQLYNIPHY